MLVADMGAVFLGTDTAQLIRIAALLPNGMSLEALAQAAGFPIEETAASVAHLIDTGILWAPEVDLIALNRHSAYAAGVCALLDARTNLEQSMTRIATLLGGPGSKVMIYGAAVVDRLQFEPNHRLVLIETDENATTISVKAELFTLIEESSETAVIGFENQSQLDAVLRTGDPAEIRRWLNADDIRERCGPDDETLVDARREYLVGEQPLIR